MVSGLEELGVTSVDTVILSLPPCTSEELTLERIQPLWKVCVCASLPCTTFLLLGGGRAGW